MQPEAIKRHVQSMLDLIYGNWKTCVTYTFAELDIPKLLHSSSKSAAALAAETGTNEQAFGRFMRCAATLGFVEHDDQEEKYSLTPFGEMLLADHPHSLRAAARLNGAPYRYQPWGHLVEILKNGSSAGYSPTYEHGSLDYLADKPAELQVFHQAMTDLSVLEDRAIIEAFDFSPFKHIVDIGCGQGEFIKAVLRKYAHLQGTMFDLPQTFALTKPSSQDEFKNRLTAQSGDFFDVLPTHGDLYVMKNVIHNWPEEKVLSLLNNVFAAMSSNTSSSPNEEKRLLIIEHLITDEHHTANWLDLNFMILVDGQERTLGEYRDLAAQTRFNFCQMIPTNMGRCIIEFSLANLS